METFDTLLQVQDHDIALDRLRHRRETLPERSELEGVEARVSQLDAQLVEVRERREELSRREGRLEQEIAAVERRITEVDRRLYSGEVSASRELQAMAAEIESLKRRRSELEDRDLLVMEEREPVDAEVAALEVQRAALDDDAGQLLVAIAEAETAIDAEVADELAARDKLAAALPPELSDQYERLRGRLGGVGAARLVNGSCTGCHLSLPASELDRIKKASPDSVILCDQCGRILVRA